MVHNIHREESSKIVNQKNVQTTEVYKIALGSVLHPIEESAINSLLEEIFCLSKLSNINIKLQTDKISPRVDQ